MSFLNSLDISGSALTAERFRMDIIAQNLSNIDVTMTPDGTPYKRQQVVFRERGLNFASVLDDVQTLYYGGALHQRSCIDEKRAESELNMMSSAYQVRNGGVRVTKVIENEDEFVPVYDPSHPDADENGYYWRPNVDRAEEQIDLMAASNAYNANITALGVIKSMTLKALDIAL